jgi:hypothetical protein
VTVVSGESAKSTVLVIELDRSISNKEGKPRGASTLKVNIDNLNREGCIYPGQRIKH